MFQSIRWRLVFSFIGITLITLSLAGMVSFFLLKQNIDKQELAFLESNAETIAQQAGNMLYPQPIHADLQVLANTASYLGNVRVKVFDKDANLLADSGARNEVDRFAWILMPRVEYTEMYVETMLVSISSEQAEDDGYFTNNFSIFDNLPPETRIRFVHRVYYPWGSQMQFDGTPEQMDENSEVMPRSNKVMRVLIGEVDSPLGFVELSEGPDFGSDAFGKALRSFLWASVLAVVIAAVLGFVFSARISKPLQVLTQQATRMGEGDLSVRASEQRKDEIGELSYQFNQMAEELQDSFDKLEAERDSLRNFIADASHELRTPITALKNFNELLQGPARDDLKARDEFLGESQNQIKRLEWVTRNLLNLSRLDAGLIDLHIVSIDPDDLLETASAPYRIQAQNRNISLTLVNCQSACRIEVDNTLLEIAVSNLIDNALKYIQMDEGQIEVGAEFLHEEDIRIWVKDNGSGIDPVDEPYVFDRFYRGKSTNVDGKGLGLAMVKSVVEAHSGTVSFESEPGRGSTFSIVLPTNAGNDEKVYKI